MPEPDVGYADLVPLDPSAPAALAPAAIEPPARTLAEVGAAFALPLDSLFDIESRTVARLLGAERLVLLLVDRETDELWTRVPGPAGLVETRQPLGLGLVGEVASTGVRVNVQDAPSEPRFLAAADTLGGDRTRAMLAVPIHGHDGLLVGVAQAANKRGGFSADDELLLASLAPLLGLGVENARRSAELEAQNHALKATQDQLRRKMAEVDLLFAIEREVSAAATLDDLLSAVLAQAQHTFSTDSVAVLLTDSGAGELHVIPSPGVEVQTRLVSAADIGSLERVLTTAEPVLLTATATALVESLAGEERRSVLCMRLVTQEPRGPLKVLGAIEWADPATGAFTDDDRALAVVVATQVGRAVALCRTRVENERTSRLALLGQMLGGLVHDMRSPMTVIGGYAELLTREVDSGARERYSNQIFTQLDQVNAMTRDVLAFIRGERQVLARRVGLSGFWQDMLPVLTRELEPNHVELKLHLEYIGAARLDEGKFRRVITNLARNAAQAMPQGGTFAVSCTAEGDTLRLRFVDNGPGMPPHVAAKLFTAFNSHGKRGGTGLGLALVKEIVEAHGGKVSCTTVEKQGTTFDIRLPHAIVP
jgi:signal transduction histidine kinase